MAGVTRDEILQLFKDSGALLEGHFILRSGLRSRQFFQCAMALQHMPSVERLGAALADKLRGHGPVTVLSPAMGGLVIGQEVARQLGLRFIFVEKEEDKLVLRRGFTIAPGEKLVIVEGVYSMDGDTPPLAELVEVCQKHGARLMIDEAHSAFVFGESGKGVVEDQGFDDAIDIHLGTFSKSLGGQGGYIAGSAQLINYLRGFSRSRFFSCALSPVVVAGLRKALELARNEPELRTQLFDNVAHMQKLLGDAQVPMGDSTSQVIPIMVRDDARVFQMGEEIFQEGVFINPVKYPAVGKHKSRFRMSISAAHTRDIGRLTAAQGPLQEAPDGGLRRGGVA